MSTNDVPGAKKENDDTLHGGCWAEHPDGSLMVVYAVEGARVIFFNLSLTSIIRPPCHLPAPTS